MKSRLIILPLIALVLLINLTNSITITGEAITGKVTSNAINMNITVVVNAPTLTLLSPENETYLTNSSILLNYTATGTSTWYNLDGGTNTTISSPTYFSTTEGYHTLYLFTNNSNLTVSKNVSFTVNSSRFAIIDTEYGGSTTIFVNQTFESIQNLNNIILENSSVGKIVFNEIINMTADLVSNDNSLNLDSNTNISFNRIEINSTALPNFNKQATLYLHNLTFTTPRILKDGSLCSTCTQQSYSGRTLVFNVTGFSVYSTEETPESSSSSSSSTSSGGGGGSRTTGYAVGNFEIATQEVKAKMTQGQVKEYDVEITNIGSKSLYFVSEITKVEKFVKLSEDEFSIEPGERKIIKLAIFAPEETIPNIYLGKLILKSEGIEKEILLAIEIQSKNALFDVRVEIPKSSSQYVLPGETFSFNVYLYNLGGSKKVDVTIEYTIPDEFGNSYVLEKETLAIETQASFIKNLKVPQELPYGKQILYVKVTYNGQVASASSWFTIGKKPPEKANMLIIIIIIIIIIMVLAGIILEMRKIKKALRHSISGRKLVKRGYIKRKR